MPLEPGGPAERHVRSTIAFDGSSGNGAQGTVDVFTRTGRVRLRLITAFCTETLEGASATVKLGGSTDPDGMIQQTTATTLAANDWWVDATTAAGTTSPLYTHSGGNVASQAEKLVSEDIIITVATQDVTNGTIIFDAFYIPITDDGALS